MKSAFRRSAQLLALFTAALLSACSDSAPEAASPAPAVLVAPSITTNPAALALQEGANASFTVTAGGSGPLTYQWQRDGVNIAGATSATLSLTAVSLADNGALFRAVVSNSVGGVNSAAAALTVQAVVLAPTISAQPNSVPVPDGGNATLSVGADGTAPFSYVWKRNGTVITDAIDAGYTTPALALADSGASYTVTVSNATGSVTSSAAVVTVNPVAPSISTAPASISVAAGQTAGFTVLAQGSASLAYQWRRNGTAIAGATAISYTTAATTLADNGALYTVLVGNAAGNTISAAATLTVSNGVTAPAVVSAPANATVSEGQTSTFSVTASGSTPLAYQWLKGGEAVSGATAASYTTAAAVLADNGGLFSVRISNSAGSVTSAAALLTVNAASSALIGRAWATGQALESDDNTVTDVRSAIDDAGRATVVFRKSNGTRNVMYSTRGTPNAGGAAPTWTTPVPIDLLGGSAVSTMDTVDFSVVAAPGGNVAAYWFHRAPCTTTTYLANVTGTCQYFYAARYLVASNAWEAPVLMGDGPTRRFDLHVNDRGDMAALGTGWVRSGSTGYTATKVVFLRSAGEAGFRRFTFPVSAIANPMVDLDAAGNLMLAAEASQNATVDLVAYRGTVAAGFGAAQVLDTRGAAATLKLAGLGLNGEQIIVWAQNNGVQDTAYAATAATPGAAFSVQDLGYKLATSVVFNRLTISDSGQAILYDFTARRRQRWAAASGWAATESLPSTLPNNPYFYGLASARSGDILAVQLGGSGDWSSYDATRNVMVQAPQTTSPGPGYVLGLSKNAGYEDLNLSQSGVGIVTLKNQYDVLPTAAAPAGDGRTVTNIWGAFFK